jgi:hypothetical protein
MATPMHTGIAKKPSRMKTVPSGLLPARMVRGTQAKARAEPAISHFSCWRRSPAERR